ncbi:hypothetical protein, partial [Thermosulfuriphilus sp.]
MGKRNFILSSLLGLMLIVFLVSRVQAFSVNVDGDLSDWGVVPGTDWSPLSGAFFAEEDNAPNSSGYIGPGYGDQPYDVEALYVTWDSAKLYLAIVTGFPQEGRDYNSLHFDAGDIAIDKDTNGTYDYAFRIAGPEAGNLYSVSSWEDVYYSSHAEANPYRMDSGVLLGSGFLSYVKWSGWDDNDLASQRYIVEVAIPLSLMPSPLGHFTVHWTVECGNDYLDVQAIHTPEPATLILIG